jgi:hypothetical protein
MAAGEVSVHQCSKAKSIFSYNDSEKSSAVTDWIHFLPQGI